MKKIIHNVKQHPTHFTLITCSHILLLTLVIYIISMNLFNVFTPTNFTFNNENETSTKDELLSLYNKGTRYVHVDAPTLYYTGYDNTDFNKVTGHYYYSLDDTTCTIYLLSSDMFTDNESIPLSLDGASFTARLSHNDANLKSLLRYMSTDIDWNYYSLSQCTGSIILDESESSVKKAVIHLIFLILISIANIIQIVNYHRLVKREDLLTENM